MILMVGWLVFTQARQLEGVSDIPNISKRMVRDSTFFVHLSLYRDKPGFHPVELLPLPFTCSQNVHPADSKYVDVSRILG